MNLLIIFLGVASATFLLLLALMLKFARSKNAVQTSQLGLNHQSRRTTSGAIPKLESRKSAPLPTGRSIVLKFPATTGSSGASEAISELAATYFLLEAEVDTAMPPTFPNSGLRQAESAPPVAGSDRSEQEDVAGVRAPDEVAEVAPVAAVEPISEDFGAPAHVEMTAAVESPVLLTEERPILDIPVVETAAAVEPPVLLIEEPPILDIPVVEMAVAETPAAEKAETIATQPAEPFAEQAVQAAIEPVASLGSGENQDILSASPFSNHAEQIATLPLKNAEVAQDSQVPEQRREEYEVSPVPSTAGANDKTTGEIGAVQYAPSSNPLAFYGLTQQPFDVTPDPAYLYLSRAHRDALASLSQGIENFRGFMTLIAEPGLGKTTLLHKLMEELQGSARVVFLFQTQCTSSDLLRYLFSELGVAYDGLDAVAMHRKLNELLFEEMLDGRRFVLIVDEAQNLDDSVLETIRLLSNFETTHSKLIQIVLAGQPQLIDTLMRPGLVQLRQRISVLAGLEPLGAAETAEYVEHRMRTAGWVGEPIFTRGALALIAEHSEGVPRRINNLCFQAMLLGYLQKQEVIDCEIVERAASKMDLELLVRRPQPSRPARTMARLS